MAFRHLLALLGGIFFWVQGFAQGPYRYDNQIPLSTGSNSPALTNAWYGGMDAPQFSKLDVNGDGVQELLVFDRSSGRPHVYRAQDNAWQLVPEWSKLLPSDLLYWVLARDFNHDGRNDLFVGTTSGMKLYQNVAAAGQPVQWQAVGPFLFTQTNSGLLNLNVPITHLPNISDIDGDGDLDVLHYTFTSISIIEFHRNMGVENFNNPDTMALMLVTERYGNVEECDCGIYSFMGQSCIDLIEGGRLAHAGSKALTVQDINLDGQPDLLSSHEDCTGIFLLPNQGTALSPVFTQATLNLPPTLNNEDIFFPAAFFTDMDFDGVDDMITAPNLASGNAAYLLDADRGVNAYKGNATPQGTTFGAGLSFLQDQMLDLGREAAPAFVDFDDDGDLDMFVGSWANIRQLNAVAGSLRLFRNTGNAVNPVFELETNDAYSLSFLSLLRIKPQFVDLDADGALDLVFSGVPTGAFFPRLFVMYNNNEAGQSFSFSLSQVDTLDFSFTPDEYPLLTDVNNDGRVDILLGTLGGGLDYYENTGASRAPAFGLVQENVLAIDGSQGRRLVPGVADLDQDGTLDLFATNDTGILSVYPDYQAQMQADAPPNVIQNLVVEGSTTSTTLLDLHTWPVAALLDARQPPSIIVGTRRGGLVHLKAGEAPPTGGNDIGLFAAPNPANERLVVTTQINAQVSLVSLKGQTMLTNATVSAQQPLTINTNVFPAGVYILYVTDPTGRAQPVSKRILVQY